MKINRYFAFFFGIGLIPFWHWINSVHVGCWISCHIDGFYVADTVCD